MAYQIRVLIRPSPAITILRWCEYSAVFQDERRSSLAAGMISPFDLADALGKLIEYYSGKYLHSALGYNTPNKFEGQYRNSQVTIVVPA